MPVKVSQEEIDRLKAMLKEKRGNVPCIAHESAVSNNVDGLGDMVAKLTSAVGIKPGSGCKKRQAWLNKLIPFR